MARINAVRYANISYDNKTSHITDICLPFFEGKNANINLANGGGKSVITLLTMQTASPLTSINDRTIYYYFGDEKMPGYILTEWLLDGKDDNDPTYFMTGIVVAKNPGAPPLVKKKNHIPSRTEMTASLSYFTFCHVYKGPNDYDIFHFKCIRSEEGGPVTIESLESARDMIRSAANNTDFWYYNKDNRGGFIAKCKEYGIPSELWAEYLSSINAIEGGFSSLFQEGKLRIDSDKLIDTFFLKSVEDKIESGAESNVSIEQNFRYIVESAFSKDKDIRKVRLYENVLMEAEKAGMTIQETKKWFDTKNSLFTALGLRGARLQEIVEDNKAVIRACEERLETLKLSAGQIRHEALSEGYYSSKRLAKDAEDACLQASDKYAKACADYDTACSHKKEVDCFLDHYLPLLEARASVSESQKAINALQSSEEAERIAELRAFLHYLLLQEVGNAQKEQQAVNEEIRDAEKKINDTERHLADLSQEKVELNSRENTLSRKTAVHDDHGNRIFSDAGITIQRNEKYRVRDDVDAALKSKWATEHEEMTKKAEACWAKASSLREEKASLQAKEENLAREVSETQLEIRDLEYQLTTFMERKAALESALELAGGRYETAVPDKVSTLLNFENRAAGYKEELDTLAVSLNSLKETERALQDSIVYIPKSVQRWLDAADIRYDTGLSFLKEQGDRYESFVSKYPLLPYGIVVRQEELKRLRSVRFPEMASFVPVFLLRELNAGEPVDVPNISPIVMENGRRFLRHYDPLMITDKDEKIRLIQAKAKAVEIRKADYEKKERDLARAVELLRNFPYDASFEGSIASQLQDEKTRIKRVESEKTECRSRLDEVITLIDKEENRWRELNAKASALLVKLNALDEWISGEPDYRQNRTMIDRCRLRVKEIEASVKSSYDMLRSMSISKSTWESRLRDVKNKIASLKTHMVAVEETPAKKPDGETSVKAVEETLKQLETSASGRAHQVEVQLARAQEAIKNCLGNISSSDFTEKDFEGKSYSEADRVEAMEKSGHYKDLRSSLEKEMKEKEARKHEADTALAVAKSKLEGRAPLLEAEIAGNFESRMRENKEETKDIASKRQKLQEVNEEYEPVIRICSRFSDVFLKNMQTGFSDVQIPADLKEDTEKRVAQYSEAKSEYGRQTKKMVEEYKKIIAMAGNDEALTGKFSESHIMIFTSQGYNVSGDEFNSFIQSYKSNADIVRKLKDLIQEELGALDREKADVFRLIFDHTAELYNGLHELFNGSDLQMDGRNLKVLRCRDINPRTIQEDVSRVYINSYLDHCVDKAVEALREGKQCSDIIRQALQPARLIRKYANKTSLQVEVYKFKEYAAQNRFVPWEESMSGGEGNSTAFIAAIVNLRYITRDKVKEQYGITPWQVLWLDNPFGASTSEHLLEPMYRLAEKNHVQMVTVTALTEPNILLHNDVIYQMRMNRTKDFKKVRMTLSSDDKEKVSEAAANWDLRGQYYMPGQMSLTMESFGMSRETTQKDTTFMEEQLLFHRK